MDLSPDPNFLLPQRVPRGPLVKWVSELVDNSIDANARRINISLRKDTVLIEDDGVGCSDLQMVFKMGDRASIGDGKRAIGRYGVGAKEAALQIGSRVLVSTVARIGSEFRYSSAHVDWDYMCAKRTWEVPSPKVKDSYQLANHTYFSMAIRGISRRIPSEPKEREKFLSDLGTTYYPAIESGKVKILVSFNQERFVEVKPKSRPELIREKRSPEEDRHWISVIGGIVKDTKQPGIKYGITTILDGGRVISAGGRYGLPDVTPGLFFEVTLSGGLNHWTIGKNKDELSPDDKEKIGKYLNDHFADLIEYSKVKGDEAAFGEASDTFAAITSEVSSIAGKAARRAKARRPGVVGAVGTVEPTGTGRGHRRADLVQDGDTFDIEETMRSCGGVQIVRESRGAEAPVMLIESNSVITINIDSPAFPLFDTSTGDPSKVMNLLVAASVYYPSIVTTRGNPSELPFPMDEAEASARADHIAKWSTELLKRLMDRGTDGVYKDNAASRESA